MMTTVGLDFGTHQSKICLKTQDNATEFYNVFAFRKPNGDQSVTLPSFIRICADGKLRYGYHAMQDTAGGQAITYFKQKMFSRQIAEELRREAECWSVLYLSYIILELQLDRRVAGASPLIYQMGMPTDADPDNYQFCKRQAIKVMVSAMRIVNEKFGKDKRKFLNEPYDRLLSLAAQCISEVPEDDFEARRNYPIFVFPEAYATLIPLIKNQRLPPTGPNLFVDIGGGTVDISFFTSQVHHLGNTMRPFLFYYHSIPCGLNAITGQDMMRSHNVHILHNQITREGVSRFRNALFAAIDSMMERLRECFADSGRANMMPFVNFCAQTLDRRPVCYSGGGSMFDDLRLSLNQEHNGYRYDFSDVRRVSTLIDHSMLDGVDENMFHILATAFALCHNSLINSDDRQRVPDAIELLSMDRLFDGIVLPNVARRPVRNWNW